MTAAKNLPVTIAQWRRNAREEICVKLDEYQGNAVIDIRCWYRSGDAGDLKPGKSGITVSTSHLRRLADATAKAHAEAARLGLVNEEGGGA